MRIDLQPAYVLHTRPFRDTSLLVDFFTQDYGRVTLVAKGARNAKQRQRYFLQPFSPLSISWQGKGELKTLIGVDAPSTSLALEGRFLYSGFYANELLVYLLPDNDEVEDIYHLYGSLLMSLQQKLSLEPTLRKFEFSLLSCLGYGIGFEFESAEGAPIERDKFYHFSPDVGFILNQEVNAREGNVFQGQYLLNIASQAYPDAATLQVAKKISRSAFSLCLQGKPIKSRELFR